MGRAAGVQFRVGQRKYRGKKTALRGRWAKCTLPRQNQYAALAAENTINLEQKPHYFAWGKKIPLIWNALYKENIVGTTTYI